MGKYEYDIGTDFDGVGGGGLAYPFVNIRQKDVKSEDGKQLIVAAGGFRFNDSRDDVETIPALFLFSHKGKTHWTSGDDNPDCKSYDGNYPVNPDTAYSHACAVCDKAQWKSGKKPECQEIIQVMSVEYDAENDEFKPFILQLKGTGIKPGKECIRSMHEKATEDELAPWHYPVLVSTKTAKYGSNNIYYIPEFTTTLEAVDEAMRIKIDEYREELKDGWLKATESPKGLSGSGSPMLVNKNDGEDDMYSELTGEESGVGNIFKR